MKVRHFKQVYSIGALTKSQSTFCNQNGSNHEFKDGVSRRKKLHTPSQQQPFLLHNHHEEMDSSSSTHVHAGESSGQVPVKVCCLLGKFTTNV